MILQGGFGKELKLLQKLMCLSSPQWCLICVTPGCSQELMWSSEITEELPQSHHDPAELGWLQGAGQGVGRGQGQGSRSFGQQLIWKIMDFSRISGHMTGQEELTWGHWETSMRMSLTMCEARQKSGTFDREQRRHKKVSTARFWRMWGWEAGGDT